MTFEDLRDARLGPLAAAAEAWEQLAKDCAALGNRVVSELTGPLRASGWQGLAATRATGRLDDLDDEFEVAALRSRTAATMLRQAVEDFESVQRRLEAVFDAVALLGLEVDGTGRVWPPEMGWAERHDPDSQLVHRRAVENARIYTDLITELVAEATAADDRIAQALQQVRALMPGQYAWEYNQVTAEARTAAGLMGLSESHVPAPGTDPNKVRDWWAGLSDDERQVYLTAYPERLGKLNGLPAADRDQANRLALRNFIGDNVNEYDNTEDPRQATAQMLLDKLESAETAPPHKRLYLLTFEPGGDGKAAVSIGNPDTAAHAAVLVPGVGTELDDIRGQLARAGAIQDAALDFTTDGEEVAVVAWLDYDPPSIGLDIVTAPFGAKSEDGAVALDGFVNGLRASHEAGGGHLTVIGHSYGSTVIGEAASTRDGLAADDIVALGSPGMRVDDVGEFNVDARHVWAGAAADDNFVARPENTTRRLIGVTPWFSAGVEAIHGPAPHSAEFGGNVLEIDTSGHSGYWERGSQSLRSQGAIVAGDYKEADLEHGRVPQP